MTSDDLVQRSRKLAADALDFNGETMKEWDRIRAECAKRDGSDLPRLMFEALIESFAELLIDAADEIERLRNQLAALPDDKRAREDWRRAAIDECIAMAQQWADQAGKSRTYPLQFTSRLFVKALRNLKDAPTPSREPRPAGGAPASSEEE